MPPFGTIKRSDLVRYLRKLGFEGPYVGGKHQYVIKGQLRLAIPNPHEGDINRDLTCVYNSLGPRDHQDSYDRI